MAVVGDEFHDPATPVIDFDPARDQFNAFIYSRFHLFDKFVVIYSGICSAWRSVRPVVRAIKVNSVVVRHFRE